MAKRTIKDFLLTEVQPLSGREKFAFSLIVGIFIFFFLIFFQPFGVNNYDPSERITSDFLFFMSLMSIYVIVVLLLNEFVFYKVILLPFNNLKAILWIVWSILWMSTCVFFFYNYLGNWHDFIWSSWFEFIGNIGSLGLLPLFGLIVYKRIESLRSKIESLSLSSSKLASLHTLESDLIHLLAENQKDEFKLALKSLLYLESQDNYVAVYHLENDQIKKTLLRNSLKRFEGMHPALIRIHRSHIINLLHLERFTGNQNNAELTLHGVSSSFSVARSFYQDFRNRLD